MSIAIPPGEHLSQEGWKRVAMEMLVAHGVDLAMHEFIVLRHLDRPHDHIHVIWCRIGDDGSLIRDRLGDGALAQEVCRNMEIYFGLRRLVSSIEGFPPSVTSSGERKRKRPSRAVYEMRKRGVVPEVDHFCARLDAAWPKDGEILPFRSLVERWEEAGIRLEVTKKGPRVGLLYEVDGKRKKASDLGEKYKWTSLSLHISGDISAEDLLAIRSIRPTPKVRSFAPRPEPPVQEFAHPSPKPLPDAPVTAGKQPALVKAPKTPIIPDLLSLVEDAYARFSRSTQEERRARVSARPAPLTGSRHALPARAPSPRRKPPRR